MTDKELVKLLKAIHDLALVPYPFPEGTDHEPHLLLALSEIAGIAMRAIKEVSP